MTTPADRLQPHLAPPETRKVLEHLVGIVDRQRTPPLLLVLQQQGAIVVLVVSYGLKRLLSAHGQTAL